MRVETKRHIEERRCMGDLGPGYDYKVEVTERLVHPESMEEKQQVFDLIQDLQLLASQFRDGLEDTRNAERQRLQSVFDAKYQTELDEYAENKRIGWWAARLTGKPAHQARQVLSWDLRHFDDNVKELKRTANYIVNTTQMLTFYTPIDKYLFENILSFKDDVEDLTCNN